MTLRMLASFLEPTLPPVVLCRAKDHLFQQGFPHTTTLPEAAPPQAAKQLYVLVCWAKLDSSLLLNTLTGCIGPWSREEATTWHCKPKRLGRLERANQAQQVGQDEVVFPRYSILSLQVRILLRAKTARCPMCSKQWRSPWLPPSFPGHHFGRGNR